MLVYRISRNQYAHDLSGNGAREVGGRWNHIGIPVVYTSERISTSFLESLCYSPLALMVGLYSITTIEIPDELQKEIIYLSDLPEDWKANPSPYKLKILGDRWVKSMKSVSLTVPCVLVPSEMNCILNPLHHDFSKVKIIDVQPVEIDQRIIDNTMKAYKESKH